MQASLVENDFQSKPVEITDGVYNITSNSMEQIKEHEAKTLYLYFNYKTRAITSTVDIYEFVATVSLVLPQGTPWVSDSEMSFFLYLRLNWDSALIMNSASQAFIDLSQCLIDSQFKAVSTSTTTKSLTYCFYFAGVSKVLDGTKHLFDINFTFNWIPSIFANVKLLNYSFDYKLFGIRNQSRIAIKPESDEDTFGLGRLFNVVEAVNSAGMEIGITDDRDC